MSETKHISLSLSSHDLKSGAKYGHRKDVVTSFSISNSELSKHIKNKKTLTEFCAAALSSQGIPNDPESIVIHRKSKKHKDYVRLETEDDFKSLARSLQVKNLLKLNIQQKPKKELKDEAEFDPNSQDAKRRKSSQDYDDNLGKSLFFELGEAALQTAFEHFISSKGNPFEHFISSKGNSEAKNANENGATNLDNHETPCAEDSNCFENKEAKPKAIHHNASCDSCSPFHFTPIVGPRYKCLVCHDFDLCAKCMVKKAEVKGHTKFHPMSKISTSGEYGSRSVPFCGNTQRRQYGRSHFTSLGLAGPWGNPRRFHHHDPSLFGTNPNFSSHYACPGAAPPHSPPPPTPNYSSPQSSSQGNDIVYDIPLGSCSLANRDKLENILRSGNIDDFFRNVDLYIEDSRRYNDLISSLKTEQDKDEKYACLLSLVEQINLDNNKVASEVGEARQDVDEEKFEIPEESEQNGKDDALSALNESSVKSTEGSIAVKTVKKFPRCLTLFLTNNSVYTIPGEQLEFEFFNDNESISINVPVPKDFAPEETKYASLRFGHDNPDFPTFGSCKLRIPTSDPSIFMEGDFVEEGTTLHPVVRNKKVLEDTCKATDSKVLVSLHVKADFFAQIAVTNYTEKEIDCSDLRFEIINCFQQSICNLVVHKRHAILPGRTSKFNISLSTAHLKYPFKLVMKNDTLEGECNMSLKNLSGEFNFSKNGEREASVETDSTEEVATETATSYDTDDDMPDVVLDHQRASSTETETDIEIREDEAASEEDEEEEVENIVEEDKKISETNLVTKSVDELRLSNMKSSSPGEIHSMVLPTLLRESISPSSSKHLSSSEYLDANSTILEKGDKGESAEQKKDSEANEEIEEVEEEDVDADYDIVSSDAGEDFGSDYEILSPVTSNTV